MTWERATDIGRRLRDLRDALGLRQEDFAEQIGVSSQSISDYETGRAQPPQRRLERVAKAVGIPLEAFMEGGPMPSSFIPTPEPQPSPPPLLNGNHLGRYEALSVEEVRARFDARMRECRGNMPVAEAVWWVGQALGARRSAPPEGQE